MFLEHLRRLLRYSGNNIPGILYLAKMLNDQAVIVSARLVTEFSLKSFQSNFNHQIQ